MSFTRGRIFQEEFLAFGADFVSFGVEARACLSAFLLVKWGVSERGGVKRRTATVIRGHWFARRRGTVSGRAT